MEIIIGGNIYSAELPEGYSQVLDGLIQFGDKIFIPDVNGNTGHFEESFVSGYIEEYYCVIRPVEQTMTLEEIYAISGTIRNEICNLREMKNGEFMGEPFNQKEIEWSLKHADFLEKTLEKLLKQTKIERK